MAMPKAASLLRPCLTAACLLAGGLASAHTVWLEPDADPGAWRVYFGGHAGETETYPGARLKSARAFGPQGAPIALQRRDAPDGVRLAPASPPALIALHYDNGIWTQTAQGRSVDRPMDEVPGARKATRAIKYHKTILQWTAFATQPLGQAFEVTPVSAEAPKAGEPMRVRVTLDGQPVAGVGIGRGEEGRESLSDADGIARFVPAAGFNKLWAGRRTPVSDNPRFTELSYEYLLGFRAE